MLYLSPMAHIIFILFRSHRASFVTLHIPLVWRARCILDYCLPFQFSEYSSDESVRVFMFVKSIRIDRLDWLWIPSKTADRTKKKDGFQQNRSRVPTNRSRGCARDAPTNLVEYIWFIEQENIFRRNSRNVTDRKFIRIAFLLKPLVIPILHICRPIVALKIFLHA